MDTLKTRINPNILASHVTTFVERPMVDVGSSAVFCAAATNTNQCLLHLGSSRSTKSRRGLTVDKVGALVDSQHTSYAAEQIPRAYFGGNFLGASPKTPKLPGSQAHEQTRSTLVL